jgi:feruloyl esterase
LEEGADLKFFKAKLNKKKVTDRFEYDDYQNRLTATLGPEDGLNVEKKKGKNTLETEIKGDKKHKRKKDKDAVKFYVTGGPAPACADLVSLELPHVKIESAEEIPADGLPAYCHVLGVIETEIRFEVNLPVDWNGKFYMGGGGGFVGSIQSQGWENALARGYATAGTDSGHEGLSGLDGFPFLNNWERIVNWGYRAIHLTTANAKIIARIFYDEGILFSYFSGCSTGGRQAMMESQRYPYDFDGIIVGAPAYSFGPDLINYIQKAMFPIGQALSDPVLPVSKLALIDDAVVANCDGEDGVNDGLIGDPRNCSFDHWDLQCTGEPGEDPSTCLTEDELLVLDRIYGPFITADGEESPAYPVGCEASPGGWDTWIVYDPVMAWLFGVPNLQYGFQEDILRYMVYHDPTFDFHDYDHLIDGNDQRLLDVYEVARAVDTDLSKFRKNGGKMIMWNGWADPILSALGTIRYYEEAESNKANAKGKKKDIRDFNRLFLMPGVLHCGGGPGPSYADFLTALENWVEAGIAPDSIIAYGGEVPERSRPLCPYPQVAVWDGVNDSDDAGSFTCQEP